MKRFMSGNHAVAEAARLARPGFVAAYPITPQTPIYEKLSDLEAEGKLGGVMMRTESEHSAMAACLSASLTGVRTFTATSSQGLALMHEMLHFAAGARTAVVMAAVNRSLALPWAFWADQTDTLAQRDTGWLQLYVENNQEALDTTLQAFCIAERLLLPVMVVTEANVISHFIEPVEVPDQEAVDGFIGPVELPRRFDTDNPAFVGAVVSQDQYCGFRRLSQEAMDLAPDVVREVDEQFREQFGRGYGLIETEYLEGADLVLVTSATITSTARHTLAGLREQGLKVGLCKIRLFRPFPVSLLREALAKAKRIAVMDRNISLGREGIFCSELKAALVNAPGPRWVQGYLAGIGGTDVDPAVIERVVRDALTRDQALDRPIWVGDLKEAEVG